MKTEISAGGVVVKKKNNSWLVLLISDMNDQWTFPKGLIEPGEKIEQAARREIAEEIGLNNLQLIAKLKPIQYSYMRAVLIDKTVHFFLFETSGEEKLHPQITEGITKGQWVNFEDAEKIIGYRDTNSKVLKEVNKILKPQLDLSSSRS